MNENYFLAFCDILGFTEMLKKNDNNFVAEKIDSLIWSARQMKSDWTVFDFKKEEQRDGKSKLSFLHFNDSLVIYSDPFVGNDDESFKKDLFIQHIADFVLLSFLSGIPLRCGLSYGKLYVDKKKKVIVGKPLIDAVELEKNQNWVGGSFHPTCPLKDILQKDLIVKNYLVPLKRSYKLSKKTALNWLNLVCDKDQAFWMDTVGFSYKEKFENILQNNINETSGSVLTKYRNTKKFYKYLLSKRV